MKDIEVGLVEIACNTLPDKMIGMPRRVLPNEPCIPNDTLQTTLTEQFLLPVLAELESFFLVMRMSVDAELQRAQPIKQGKPYPSGQCLEITLAVQQRLRHVDAAMLNGPAATGYRAYVAFRRAGGAMRQVWGDLRGQYFQNAFQLGLLYVDVSNDTVTLTKPKVEILPFEQAQFVPITDFRHFMRIAWRYWKDRIYPNHVVPELAPYCPLVHISPKGVVLLHEPTHYMVAMAQAKHFLPSEDVLCDPAMPEELFTYMVKALAGTRLKLPRNAEEGRAQALKACREHRAKRWHLSQRQTAKVITVVHDVNNLLARVTQMNPFLSESAGLHVQEKKMNNPQTIQIDGIDYSLADLSAEARKQLEMLLVTDVRLKELQHDLAIAQTARSAYSNALISAVKATEEAPVEKPKKPRAPRKPKVE